MNRREFFKDSAVAGLSLAFGMQVQELVAQSSSPPPAPGPPVSCAVVGLGTRGREMLASLARMSNAPVLMICDDYTVPAYVKHATEIVPGASFVSDYRQALSNPSVQAVFVATPSHRHRDIAVDALAAGKHVYCEAPLATDLTEARAIASAGASAKTVFQSGLQYRSNKQHNHVLGFVRAEDLGNIVGGRAQWHKKVSWRRPAPPDPPGREQAVNWRLYKGSSSGLPGEVGIHAFDIATWYQNTMPLSVTAFGSVLQWKDDGMQVPDTVQCILEYPGNVRFIYDATLGDSFDGAYELFMGSDSAILIRDQRAWMFKEIDSPLLGWEVYARKDKMTIGDESSGTGIALVADATKLIAQGKQPGEVGTDVSRTALYQALEAFLDCVRSGKKPAAGALEGFQATVVAHKVHEATLSGAKVTFVPDWFALT